MRHIILHCTAGDSVQHTAGPRIDQDVIIHCLNETLTSRAVQAIPFYVEASVSETAGPRIDQDVIIYAFQINENGFRIRSLLPSEKGKRNASV